jgi:hypothetical protein
MARPKRLSPELLQAALAGLQVQLADVKRTIADVSEQIRPRGGRPAAAGVAAPAEKSPVRRRRGMSAAARKRIAEAQRKRWAAFHAQAAAGKTKGRPAVKKAAKAAKAVKAAKAPKAAKPAAVAE